MRNLIFLSFLLLSGFCLVSCDKDDEDIKSSNLIGTWKATHSTGYYKDTEYPQENEEWDEDVNYNITITFNADGTCLQTYQNETENGTWKLDGKQLSIKMTIPNGSGNDQIETSTVTLLELTKSKFVIEDIDKDETSEYYSKDTYTKIK